MRPAARAATLLAAALLLGAQGPTPNGSDPVVAQSGDVTVTASAMRRLVDAAEPDARAQLLRDPATLAQLARRAVLQKILLDAARAKKFDQDPDVAARADEARDSVIANAYVASLTQPPPDYPSDAEVQAAYEANKARLVVPRQYHLAQIFAAVPPNAPASADDDARKKLAALRTQLLKPKADFADAARKNSDDRAGAEKGGELGWLREDALLPPVKDAVAGLQEGAISEPVRAPDGWHLLRLLGTRPAAPATLPEVRDQLVRALRAQRLQQNERAYVDDLLRRQPILIDEIQLPKAVQR